MARTALEPLQSELREIKDIIPPVWRALTAWALWPGQQRSKAHRLKAVLGADQGALKVLHHAGAKTDGID